MSSVCLCKGTYRKYELQLSFRCSVDLCSIKVFEITCYDGQTRLRSIFLLTALNCKPAAVVDLKFAPAIQTPVSSEKPCFSKQTHWSAFRLEVGNSDLEMPTSELHQKTPTFTLKTSNPIISQILIPCQLTDGQLCAGAPTLHLSVRTPKADPKADPPASLNLKGHRLQPMMTFLTAVVVQVGVDFHFQPV